MTTAQGDLKLLLDPVAQQLLESQQVAHLAYTWTDGTPRVVPIWFTWTGEVIVFVLLRRLRSSKCSYTAAMSR